MNGPKRLCVFCASSMGRAVHSQAAREVGMSLVRRGVELVYGGAHVGLMGLIADTVLEAGGRVTGVIPRSMMERELAHTSLTALRVVETMHERKAMMAELSDAFLALPGGYGTLDELFEIITWAQLRIHSKPVGVLNVDGFYDSLLDFLDGAVRAGFLKAPNRELFAAGGDIEAMLDRLLA